MAQLRNCVTCGEKVSTAAPNCPYCGQPEPTGMYHEKSEPCVACGNPTKETTYYSSQGQTYYADYRICTTGGWGVHCEKCGHKWHMATSPSILVAECPKCGEKGAGTRGGLRFNNSNTWG